jgi:hypothetical protein
MKVSTHTNAVAFAMVCLLISQAINAAQPWYELQIVLPSSASGQVTTQLTGGWPLVIRATAPSSAPTYSYDNDGGPLAVVAADPSGCFDELFFSDPNSACLSQVPDEVYTSPWLDLDAPGREDVSSGDSGLIRALVDSEGGGGPVFFGLVAGSETSVTAGPVTGGEVRDGYGYGANDDWPQLVLLSNRGVGVVLDEHFNRGPTEERRNLAALLEWVAYDLADAKGRSAVSSGTIVPYALFSPLIMVDEAIGQTDATGGAYIPGFKFRIDGSADRSGSYSCLYQQYFELLYGAEVELRAFLVSGSAPSVLSDMDGDSDVDAADAELSGLKVISSERTARFRLWDGVWGVGNSYYNDRANRIYADFDGNGDATNRLCDSNDIGPGKVRPPPK